jgi:integrase
VRPALPGHPVAALKHNRHAAAPWFPYLGQGLSPVGLPAPTGQALARVPSKPTALSAASSASTCESNAAPSSPRIPGAVIPAKLKTFGTGTPLASFTRTYGGAQAAHPKHWLTREQAYTDLIDACQLAPCPELALRDEIALRLGLAGLRRFEIASLTVAHVAQLPHLAWTGKRNKPRKATLHPRLCEAIRQYLALYPSPQSTDPLLCPANCHSTGLWWHRPLGLSGLYKLVARKGTEAGISYLGVHDLRRTAAGLLHAAKTDEGAHVFDLLDIQQVLGHSDPVVTMKCYLQPIATETLDRAASYLG